MRSARHSRGCSARAAAIRSFILPGWGQLAQGRREVGVFLLALTAVIVAVLTFWLYRSPADLAGLFVQPGVLRRTLVLNVIILGLRLWATADAWRAGDGPHQPAWIVAILVITVAPHLAVGWVQARTYDVLTTVFTTTTTVVAAPTTHAGSGSGDGDIPGDTVTVTTTIPVSTTSTIPFGGRLTVLLLGGDAGPGRTGIRTDTMIVATIDTTTGDIAMFGLPRNLKRFTFSDGTPFTAFSGILNEVYPYGEAHPELFPGPDPGAAAIIDVAETITGLSIDHYALVDLNAFVGIIDALGGITLYIPHDVYDPGYPLEDGTEISIRIPAGEQELDGTEALAYARIRYGTSDYDRMERQRCLLSAVTDQVDVGSLLRGLPGLLTAVEENVRTDIPLDRLPDLIRLAGIAKAGDAIQIGFGPPDWNSGRVDGGYPVPDIPKIQEAVQLVVSDPAAALEAYQLQSAANECEFNGPVPTTTTTTTTTTAPTTTTTTTAPTTTTAATTTP